MTSRRKRFRKFLMSCGLQRNEANVLISAFDGAKTGDEQKAIVLYLNFFPRETRKMAKHFLPAYRIARKERRIQF